MTRHPLWNDAYWLLLLQLYLRKPAGVKPIYSRQLVELSLELHIRPQLLYEQMFHLRNMDSPSLCHIWKTFADNPRRLSREVKRLKAMQGFGHAQEFYKDVDVNESFETDFRPIPGHGTLTPMMLTIIFDLYFRLTPATMVKETPELQELARLLHLDAGTVVKVMETFQCCDPYLGRRRQADSGLLPHCQRLWQLYGNDNPEKLAATAAQMKEYFR